MKPLIYLFLLTVAFAARAQNTFNAVAVRTNITVAGAPPVLTVNTLADVITFQPQGGRVVQTRGYHAPGDGGHGLYRWTNALPAGVVTNRGTWFAGSSGFWGLSTASEIRASQFGVVGDGITDNSTVISDMFDAASATGSVVVFDVAGTVIAHRVLIDGVANLQVTQSNGLLKSLNGETGEVLQFTNCPNLRLSNLNLSGNASMQVGGSSSGGFGGVYGTAALALVDCKQTELRNVSVSDFVFRGVKLIRCDLSSAIECKFYDASGGALAFVDSDDTLVNGCSFENIGTVDADSWYIFHCLDIVGNLKESSRSRVIGNAWKNTGQTAIQFTKAKDSVFVGNTLNKIGWTTYKNDGGSGESIVYGNYFSDMGGYGLFFGGSFGDFNGTITVANNAFVGWSLTNSFGRTVFTTGTMVAFRHPPKNATIVNNTFEMNGQTLGLLFHPRLTFSDNRVLNCGFGLIVNTGGSVYDSIFRGNLFSNITSSAAIQLTRATGGELNHRNEISGNRFLNCGLAQSVDFRRCAIALDSGTLGTKISGNYFFGGAGGFPVWVGGPTRSIFENNICETNNWRNVVSFGRSGDRSVLSRNRFQVSFDHDFGLVPNTSSSTLSIAVTGVLVRDRAFVSPNIQLQAGVSVSAIVSAPDTVTVTVLNNSGSSWDVGLLGYVLNVIDADIPMMASATIGQASSIEQNASLSITSGGTNSSAGVFFASGSGASVWEMATSGAQTGSNAGMDFILRARSDAGGTLGTAATFKRDLGSVFAGPVSITGAGINSPLAIGNGAGTKVVEVNGGSGSLKEIRFLTGGTNRWRVGSSSATESGSNEGSDFQIISASDSGSSLNFPFIIKRQTGSLILGQNGTETRRIRHGVATLVGGTVTVSDANVTANTRIMLTSQSDGGTPGWVRVSARTPSTSFTITSSSGTDTSTIGWVMIEP